MACGIISLCFVDSGVPSHAATHVQCRFQICPAHVATSERRQCHPSIRQTFRPASSLNSGASPLLTPAARLHPLCCCLPHTSDVFHESPDATVLTYPSKAPGNDPGVLTIPGLHQPSDCLRLSNEAYSHVHKLLHACTHKPGGQSCTWVSSL